VTTYQPGIWPPPPTRRPAVHRNDPPAGGIYRSTAGENTTRDLTASLRRAHGYGPGMNPAAAVPPPPSEAGVADWTDVAGWAAAADTIGTADPEGVLWCAAGGQCYFPRAQRFNPARPGDPARPITELFAWLAEHWGCPHA
jgi:hypothetical protein